MPEKPRPLRKREKEKFKVLGGNSNPELVQKICRELGIEPVKAAVDTFSDGETRVEIEENIRGSHIFAIQSTCPPVNHHLMELFIMIDAARRASVREVTAVLPYWGYGRQDRKSTPRTPISSRLIADLFIASGMNRLIALDLHAGQIEGCFDNLHPLNHIYIRPVFLKDIKARFSDLSSFTFVSPDSGGVARARAYAKRLNCPVAHIDKRREGVNRADVMNIIGDVAGRNIIIIDDIADTVGTIRKSAEALKEAGALKIWCYVTHPVLSGNAVENIEEAPVEELVVSNSIPLSQKAVSCRKIKALGVERLLAYAILNVFRDKSLSEMLEMFEDYI
jgi:ribose-phosphate pyrophosphokinase